MRPRAGRDSGTRTAHRRITWPALAAMIALAGCMTLDSFMFAPEKVTEPYDFSDQSIPQNLFAPDGAFVTTSDGEEIHTFFVQSSGAVPARAGVTVLYCHGNSAHIRHHWPRVEHLHAMGYQVLIFDYRGYGRSTGEPSEPGLYRDADAALASLLARPEVDPSQVVFYGHSLGAAVCTDLAYRNATQPAALVLEAPFRSVQDLVQDGAGVGLHPGFVTTLSFDNYGKIPSIGAPLLVMHGLADDYLQPQYGEDLYEHAADPKSLWLVPGAGHSSIPGADGSPERQAYLDRFTAFVDCHLGIGACP